MGKPSLREFLENRNFLAIKLSSGELSGLFQKRLVVPMNTVGLAMFADGSCALMPQGQEVRGRFELLLAKEGDIALRFPFDNLRSADGHVVSAVVDLHLRLQTRRDDLLRDFARAFFNFPGHYTQNDLKNAIGPEVRRLVADYAAAREAAALHKRDHSGDLGPLLRCGLERTLFGSGVDLIRTGDASIESSEYAEKASAEARRDAEKRTREERFQRKEEKFRRLASLLQDQPVRELLERIPDDRARGLLYAKLMEDDSLEFNARELAARLSRGPDDVSDLIFRAMEGLLSSTSVLDAQAIEPEVADRVYAALGSMVLEIDPARPGDKPRDYVFKHPLRSVRPAEIDGQAVLLVGCKRTIHVLIPGEKPDCREYPMPGDQHPKGGVNAIATVNGSLFATHSEYGLVRWDRSKPGVPGELIFTQQTSRQKTVRGVVGVGSRLVFAAGPTVWAAAPHEERGPVAYDTRLDSAITALAVGAGQIYAGTEGGAIVTWSLDQPDKPLVLVRRKDPISNLRLASICSIPHLLYSAKDPAVRARVIGQTLETSYESGGAGIGVLDAASDLVAAGDGPGRRLYLWRATEPAKPFSEIDLGRISEKPLLDLGMRKVRTAAAAARP